MKIIKRILCLIFVSIFVILMSGCTRKDYGTFNSSIFNTWVQFEIFNVKYKDFETYRDHIDEILNKYDALTTRYSPRGEIKNIYYINHHLNEEIVIDEDLFDLIKYSIDTSKTIKDSNGKSYFNILIGGVSDLYHELFMEHNGELIDEFLLPEKITFNTNLDEIELNEVTHSIKLKDNMSLDLGGVAKGYAIDKVREYLDSYNLSYYINAGGSTLFSNNYNDEREGGYYNIGLINPVKTNEAYTGIKLYKGHALSVSGDYQKYFVCNDRIYSHILDPSTSESVITDIRSIAVITDSCAYGDILSTSLFMMGSTEAIKYAELNNLTYSIYKNGSTNE